MENSTKIKVFTLNNFDRLPQIKNLPQEDVLAMKAVAHVFPFKVNNYVVEELIDWNNIPEDPIFQLTFPQKEMLNKSDFDNIYSALKNGSSKEELTIRANRIRMKLNPHPAGQLSANIARFSDGEPVPGIQHKYRETVLVFPSAGQTCHSYCTFCFRWAQFIGVNDLKFATDEANRFLEYLRCHKEVTDVLFTGGDPMIMSAKKLSVYITPLLAPEFEHIKNIRIGTKTLTYWPFRYLTDTDSDEIIELFEKIVRAGKHLSIMAHVNHFIEISTEVSAGAVRRIRSVGAEIRTQSPVIKHINDNPKVWEKMWKKEVAMGMIPYYFFVERDTGAKEYFSIPLVKALQIFREAYSKTSGLIRTVRGPSMSALPGKIEISGITKIYGEKVFALNFIQGRNPDWIKKPFFAQYDPDAIWLDDLKPAFGETKFFYENELEEILQGFQVEKSEKKNLENILAG